MVCIDASHWIAVSDLRILLEVTARGVCCSRESEDPVRKLIEILNWIAASSTPRVGERGGGVITMPQILPNDERRDWIAASFSTGLPRGGRGEILGS